MQSPSSILDFSHSPSKITSTTQLETLIKQQKANNNTPPTNVQTSEIKAPNSDVSTSFFYKITEYLAYTSSYTSAAISDTYNTLMVGGTTEPEHSARKRSYKNGYHGDVMQINSDDSDGAYYNDEISDSEIEYNTDKKIDRKNDVKWSVNDEDYEPPPPYDSSWVMPKSNSGENSLTGAPMSSSPKEVNFEASSVESKSTSTPEDTNSATMSQTIPNPRRRQIRVRRPRRLLRRKSASTEVSTPQKGGGKYDDPEELLLKVNDKLSDMIAQGRAALTSTVDVTEVEMLLAEEKEKDERIMKEVGQVGLGRKGRKTVDHDHFGSMSDGNYSPEYFDYGYGVYGGHGSGFVSPSGYDTPDYPSHGHYNTPSQFGSPGAPPYHHQTQGGYYSNLGYGLNNHNKFGENDFSPIPNHYYGQPSNGFVEHAIPKGFGAGPLSAGFGGKFGRYGPNNNNGGFNYGHGFGSHGFGSNANGFGSNVFGSNGGYRGNVNGMYNNNNREFLY